MRHGFYACDPVGAHDWFHELRLVERYGAADADCQLMDFTL